MIALRRVLVSFSGACIACTFAFASACTPRDLQIVAGTHDSLVVNNRTSVELPVYGLDAHGRRHTLTGLKYQRVGGDSIPLTADGHVTCDRRADARVTVVHEHSGKTFSLLCRSILSIGVQRVAVLSDGDSATLEPIAIGMDGERERLIAGDVMIEDTSIAYVDHETVFGRRAGQTHLVIGAGDCSDWTTVDVNERVASSTSLAPFQVFVGGPVELVPGEIRTWSVGAGSYTIWTQADDRGFALGTSNINCVADAMRTGRYICVAPTNGTVIVRNVRRKGSASVRGTVFVSRTVDAMRDSSYVRAHPPRPAPTLVTQRRLPAGWCNSRSAHVAHHA